MITTLVQPSRAETMAELQELGEAMMHCRAAYCETFKSLEHRAAIEEYYKRLNRRATALSTR